MMSKKDWITDCDELISSFLSFDWTEIKLLSEHGSIGPHNDVEFALLITRKKPMALTSPRMANQFERYFGQKDFKYYPIECLKSRHDDMYKGGICSPDNIWRIHQAEYAFLLLEDPTRMNTGASVLTTDILLGDSLGYSKNDLCKWIERNLGEEKFDIWKEQYAWRWRRNYKTLTEKDFER